MFDPRDVFVRAVDLPLDIERELVRDRDRTYEINGTDSRVLATVGAFRVVAESDLERACDNPGSARDSVKHLEAEGLLSRSRSGPDERVTFLSSRGRDLLEASRWERDDRSRRPDQAFYAGLRKPRGLGHDSQVYRAYLRAEERLRRAGGRVRRVALDYELKRDYCWISPRASGPSTRSRRSLAQGNLRRLACHKPLDHARGFLSEVEGASLAAPRSASQASRMEISWQ